VDVHDMPAKPKMFIQGLIFSEKHYTNRDRNHNPYVVIAFCLCTRSASCRPGRTSSPHMKGT